jgi:6-pyruvoyltetrahydropterin/6-carboxytetrahydropterin synthase
MIAHFSRRYTFSASHRLHVDHFSAEQNRVAFGKCNNPHGHGHNYVVQVTVSGPVDPATGMVLNMATLDAAVHTAVLDRFDHRNLNHDPLFAGQTSTTENLCCEIYHLLASILSPVTLRSVRIEETENNFFEYSRTSLAAASHAI